jgi:acyl-CoA reductase-like NAD-dependent aldehyde dehydrogenase
MTSSKITIPLLINGKETITSTIFDVISPSTEEHLWQCSGVSKSEALDAVSAAEAAFQSWSRTKPAFRRDILLKAAVLFEKRADECHEFMMKETGAAEAFSKFNTDTTAEMFRDISGRIVSALQGEIPICQQEGTSALVVKDPYGVVLGIAPWNAPFILGLRAFIYALAVGNTVVLKGSELSPRCFWVLGSVLTEAGLPPGCLNIIYHRPQDAAEVTTALIAHPAVRKINFTGSTAVGSIIATTAGKHLKPVLLELGGKASAIVCADADLEKAARECALGAFLHVRIRLFLSQNPTSTNTEIVRPDLHVHRTYPDTRINTVEFSHCIAKNDRYYLPGHQAGCSDPVSRRGEEQTPSS